MTEPATITPRLDWLVTIGVDLLGPTTDAYRRLRGETLRHSRGRRWSTVVLSGEADTRAEIAADAAAAIHALLKVLGEDSYDGGAAMLEVYTDGPAYDWVFDPTCDDLATHLLCLLADGTAA